MTLSIRRGDSTERVIEIARGKTTIGSSPRCDIQLAEPGVSPLHLLILDNGDTLIARSWGGTTRQNGEVFAETAISPGDQLTLGTVVLEVGEHDHGDLRPSHLLPAEQANRMPESPPAAGWGELAASDTTGHSECSGACNDTNPGVHPRDRQPASPRRKRKRRSTLQRSQREFRRLAERVEGLEGLLEAALFECTSWAQANNAAVSDATASKTESDSHPGQVSLSESTASTTQSPAGESERALIEENARLTEQIRQLIAARQQLELEKTALEDELAAVQRALSAEANELADRRDESNSIENERNQWAIERAEWEQQRATLQDRLADSERQIAEYVRHVQDLEQELKAVRDSHAAVRTESSQWQGEDFPNRQASAPDSTVDDIWRPAETRRRQDSSIIRESIWASPVASPAGSSRSSEVCEEGFEWEAPKKASEIAWTDSVANGAESIDSGSTADSWIRHEDKTTVTNWENLRADADEAACIKDACSEAPIAESGWPATDAAGAAVNPAATSADGSGTLPQSPAGQLAVPNARQAAEQFEGADELSPFGEFSIWKQGTGSAEASTSWGNSSIQSNAAEGNFLRTHGESSFQSLSDEAATGFHGERPHHKSEPTAVGPGSDATAVPSPAKAGSDSFISRFAHLFDEDDSKGATALHPSPEVVHEPGVTEALTPAAGNDDEEESIEQYMAKLMQRVRGETNQSLATPPAQGATLSPKVPAPPNPVHGEFASAATAAAQAAEPKHEYLTTSLGTLKRKSVGVEQVVDLEAFRALANESARRAISTHSLRKHRRNAVTKVIVATLAGMTSVYVMLESPDWLDLQYITACVSLIAAAYWAGQAYRTVLESFRAAAYDGPEESTEQVLGVLHPTLPIDVEC